MIELTYKLTFHLDSQTGQIKTPTESQPGQGSGDTITVNDRGLEDLLHHAREAASAYDNAPGLRLGPPPARRSRATHGRFAPRGGRAGAAKRGNWSPLDLLRSAVSLPRLREVAFAALSTGVTLGALLIAFVHGATGNLSAPAQPQTNARAAGTWAASGANLAVTVNVTPAVAASTQLSALVTPAVSTLMYEGGEFATRARAVAQVNDLRASGVRAFVSAGPPYILLFAPVASGVTNAPFESYLQHAEAPFYVRSWTLPGKTLPMTGLAPSAVKRAEQLVVDDARVLEGLLAIHAGYQAPQLGAWEQATTTVFGAIGKGEWNRLDVLGKRLRSFHRAVQNAYGATLLPAAGAGRNASGRASKTDAERQRVLLTEALVAYEALVRG